MAAIISPKKAIQKFNVRLLTELPLDNQFFLGEAHEAELFPLGTREEIVAEKTRADKVALFLRKVVEPGADAYLPKLLDVMDKCGNVTVKALATDIRAATGLSGKISATSGSSANSSPAAVNVESDPSLSGVTLFINYAWEEATNDFVVRLKGDLERTGLKVFLDKHEIFIGCNIQHEVAKGMDDADGIIVVYSERYPDSKWCDNELQMAQKHNKAIFPLRRIKGPYKSNIGLAIGGILYADFTDDNADKYSHSLDMLIKGIKHNCVRKT